MGLAAERFATRDMNVTRNPATQDDCATIRSVGAESFRPAQTLCCDGPDSKVIEDLCVVFTASPKARPRSAIGFERGMTTQATCRCSHRSFPTRRPRSFATEQLANASSSWRAGGCPGPSQYGGQPVTNIRNAVICTATMARQAKSLRSPGDSFCEYADTKPRKTPTWFAPSEDRAALRLRRPPDALARCADPKSAPIEALTA
jgi:hypothetical protein